MAIIKNIIFDLGGVILDLDRQRLFNAFAKFSAIPLDKVFNQRHQIKLFDLFEIGKISEAEFRKGLIEKLQIAYLSDDEFDHAWNSMLLDIPIERLNCIKALRKNYTTILLSNTNTIHIKRFENILTQNHLSFNDYFDRVYYSCSVGMRKPEHNIFKHILTENNLKPEETLFIDDTLENIESAQRYHMQVMHIADDKSVLDIPHYINTHFCHPAITSQGSSS